jgi:hypothetical protein
LQSKVRRGIHQTNQVIQNQIKHVQTSLSQVDEEQQTLDYDYCPIAEYLCILSLHFLHLIRMAFPAAWSSRNPFALLWNLQYDLVCLQESFKATQE